MTMTEGQRTLFVAEPPARYMARPPIVVDCSTIAGLVFMEHWHEAAQAQIQGRTLHAPHLIDCEIANVALKKLRRDGVDIAIGGLERVASLDITLHPIHTVAVVQLAQRYQLSAYDAAYLWLAAELPAPLATFDAKLAEAARLHLSSLS